MCSSAAHDVHHNRKKRNPFSVNIEFQRDPTRTLTLRTRFVAEMNRRFKGLMRAIKISIVDNDAFGLRSEGSLFTQEKIAGLFLPAPMNSFKFPLDADKVSAFNEWLQKQIDEGILETRTVRGVEGGWTNDYVRSGYQKGIQRSRAELRAAGVPVPSDLAMAPFAAVFGQPFHARRLQNIYTRSFADLKNITEAMSVQISDVLTTALAEGRGPRTVAKYLKDISDTINGRVQKIGLTRAKTLARTEIVRAHHLATIEEYENFGAMQVRVKGEWVIAGYNTCAYCAGMDGRIFDLDTIRGLIPAHPNCRCVATPITAFSDMEKIKAESEARKSRNIEWWDERANDPKLSKRDRKAAEVMSKRLKGIPPTPRGAPIPPSTPTIPGTPTPGTAPIIPPTPAPTPVRFAKDDPAWTDWNASLTEAELAAAEEYGRFGYQPINRYWRGQEMFPGDELAGWNTAKIKDTTKKLTSSIKKAPALTETTTVYRGVNIEEGLDDFIDKLKKQPVFRDKGFVSTSLSEDAAISEFGGNVIMEIKLPPGTKGNWMEISRPTWEYEKEFLLGRNQKFVVESVERIGDVGYKVKATLDIG